MFLLDILLPGAAAEFTGCKFCCCPQQPNCPRHEWMFPLLCSHSSSLITFLTSFDAFDQTQSPKRSPVQKSHTSPGVTPGLGHQAPFICSLFKLMEWFGRVHNCLSPSTSSVIPQPAPEPQPKSLSYQCLGGIGSFPPPKAKTQKQASTTHG